MEEFMTGLKQNLFNRMVLVSNRLPFKVVQVEGQSQIHQSSGGLISAILSLSESSGFIPPSEAHRNKIQWIGYAEPVELPILSANTLNVPFDLHPLVVDSRDYDGFYNGFSNDYLWPLFHYFTSYAAFKESYFEKYRIVNERACDIVATTCRPGDFIWVHDYHFLLLPNLIRQRMPDAMIGFFLHIPFPSFEIFRLVPKPCRDMLINGLIGSDLIGFHTNDYMQHFLDTVRKLCGYEHDRGVVKTEQRLVKVDFFPIGIDYEKFHTASLSAESNDEIHKIQSQIANARVIFSIDRLDYTKGLYDRLVGFELFLEKYPAWHGKVIFIMVVIPSRDTIAQYQEMKKQIEATIGRINGAYCTLLWQPIVYQYKSLSFTELVSLYTLSDIALITPLRDGMNLVAKEFIACQTSDPGMLILSEMAGASAELAESLIINPVNRQEVAEAIKTGLEMPVTEKEQRINRMQKRIRDYDVFTWAQDYFNQFEAIRKAQDIFKVNIISPSKLKDMASHYQSASRRIFFLDYDGTLVPYAKYPEQALPTEEVLHILRNIGEDEKNTVVIISGRDTSFLEKWFGMLRLHIIAEHGAYVKNPGEKWKSMLKHGSDTEWKKIVFPIFDRYTDRCSGAYLEEKSASFAWHYRNVDPEIAALRSNELKEELNRILMQNKELQLLAGNKVIEVKRAGYSKGTAAALFLKNAHYSFIAALGDDVTDEDLFKIAPVDAYTIKVGVEPSIAKFNLMQQSDVVKFFNRLCTME